MTADDPTSEGELRRRLDAAATVIATLHHENSALRQQLDRSGTVVALSATQVELASATPTDRATSQTAAHQTDPDGDAT